MPLYQYLGKTPQVHQDAFVHPLASIIGDVTIGPDCYIGPHASLRGDFGVIVVEMGSNVQDNCTLHVGHGQRCVLEANAHIGHGAVVHSALLRPNVLVGMNAVVLDDAELGESSIVAACAFVKARWQVPAGVLVAGVPGRVVRALSEQEKQAKIDGTRHYQTLARDCLKTFRQVG